MDELEGLAAGDFERGVWRRGACGAASGGAVGAGGGGGRGWLRGGVVGGWDADRVVEVCGGGDEEELVVVAGGGGGGGVVGLVLGAEAAAELGGELAAFERGAGVCCVFCVGVVAGPAVGEFAVGFAGAVARGATRAVRDEA